MITIIHVALAIILFLIQNWIGSRAYSKGYIRFSLLDDKDEALSLNFVIKVFGPIVYLIIVVALSQYFKIDSYVKNIINVIYYYITIRVVLILLFERFFIVNWFRILIYYSIIIMVSTIIYSRFIDSVQSLLPDFSEIKNEIWLLIIIFIYQIGNGFEENVSNNQIAETSKSYLPELKKRKKIYILKRYSEFRRKYDEAIKLYSINDHEFETIIYAILIYENFNRPRVIRWLERLWVRLSRKNVTQGIMQVKAAVVISDEESIKKGTEDLFNALAEYKSEEYPYNLFAKTIKKHCPDRKYIRQILFIAKSIIENDSNFKSEGVLYDEIKSEFELYG